MNLQSDPLILFQGDSITDAGRKRKNYDSLGEGYVMLTAAWISASHPEFGARFINRGVGGNRVGDLRNRWKKDCLDLKPDIVSILVGINDAHGKPCWREPTSLERFESDYQYILEQTLSNSKTQVVLLEPFLLAANQNYKETLTNLKMKIDVVRDLAKRFKTTLIPLSDIFAEAASEKGHLFWTLDGVHPTLAGHALIAQSWIKGTINLT